MTSEVALVCAIEPPTAVEVPQVNGREAQPLSSAADYMEGRIKMATEEKPVNGNASVVADLSLPDTDGISHRLSEFTALGPAVLVYARGAWCPFCLRQLSDYADRYAEFKPSGIEVVALSPESQRKSRRLRTGLKLPFTVLSDSKLEAAKNFSLIGHEKPGELTPATLVLDINRNVRLSALNQAEKCVFARDTLQFARALKQGVPTASMQAPQTEKPKPGWLFARALMNMASGLVSR